MKLVKYCIFIFLSEIFQEIVTAAGYIDILNELDYKNEESMKRFLRINSPKTPKSVRLFQLFESETVKSFTLECIFRFKIWSRQQLVLFHLTNNKHRIWIYVENGNIAVEFKISDENTIGYFKNPWVYDQQWHKIFLSYSKGDLELYFDCIRKDYVGPKHPELLKYSKLNDMILSILFLGRQEEINDHFDDIDIKSMKLYTGIQRPYEQNCIDIPNANMFRKIRGSPGPPGPPGLNCICN